jgi:hypothetical protein
VHQSPVHDYAWRTKAWCYNDYLMHAWLFPNTAKDKRRIPYSHQGEVIRPFLAAFNSFEIIQLIFGFIQPIHQFKIIHTSKGNI